MFETHKVEVLFITVVWSTQVWSVLDTSVDQTGHLCGARATQVWNKVWE